jgi:hypothetical protein
MYQHNPELRGSEILGNEVWGNGNFKLPIINYDSLSLRALAAIICHKDAWIRSWLPSKGKIIITPKPPD